jgi:hypothetical protein
MAQPVTTQLHEGSSPLPLGAVPEIEVSVMMPRPNQYHWQLLNEPTLWDLSISSRWISTAPMKPLISLSVTEFFILK